MKITLVTTTINVPFVVKKYLDSIGSFGHDSANIIVIGDINTAAAAERFLSDLKKIHGKRIDYWPVARQRAWLKRFPGLERCIPYRSVQRRNIGYLVAAEEGADMIISFDDDNWPAAKGDFISEHAVVGRPYTAPSWSSSNNWLNLCAFLKSRPSRPFYHRGYPMNRRWADRIIRKNRVTRRVAVNVGLWLGDPDIDTVTRFEEPLSVTGVRISSGRFFIAPGILAPFNSQNTAFDSRLLPAAYLISFRHQPEVLRGNNNFRYDDIWMSFFMKKIIDANGDGVLVGRPIVTQKRNVHDGYLDLQKEIPAYRYTEVLAPILESIRIKPGTYAEGYRNLIEVLGAQLLGQKSRLPSKEKNFFREMLSNMSVWSRSVSKITGSD
jgi:hypothetical protein